MRCLNCGDLLVHGYCERCKKYCGCSFDPTSLNDYCEAHRPVLEKKRTAKESK